MNLVFHVDLDAFFASVEQLRNPALRGRPVIVGSGVIASCSYEARARGLANAMPIHEARRLCPEAVVVEGRHEIYRCFTDAVWEICRRWAPGMETFLDEADCDFTGTGRLYRDPLATGRRIRADIKNETGLAVTLGIARNRMIAKMAAKSVKPDGLRWLREGEEDRYLLPLPVRDLPGVGPRTAALLADMNIRTIGEFRALPVEALEAMLGRTGRVLHERARGDDTRPIRENEIPKTISRETTFHRETSDRREIDGMLLYLLERALRTARRLGVRAKTVRVRIRYEDFGQEESARTLPRASAVDEDFHPVARDLLRQLHTRRVNLRHLGVTLSRLQPEAFDPQLQLFEEENGRFRRIHEAVDRIRDKYGHGAVVSGRSINLLKQLHRDSYGYILRTPCLTK